MDKIRIEKMFDDLLLTNRALLDYKKGLFDQLVILVFFQRGDAMNLVQNERLLFGLLLEEIRPVIMFDDRLVTNRFLVDYKKALFCQEAILQFFLRGNPMNLVQN